MYLSDGLVEGRDAISPDDVERLRTADLSDDELEELVGRLVDRVVRSDGLARLENDVVQALLLLQRRDPALQRRIVRFLRGEALNQYDRRLLGGLAPRDRPEDPLRTIKDLATVMHELQLAALVLVVDQLEDAVSDGQNIARLQRALDTLRAIADAVPSSVVVISCLQDVYDSVKGKLSQTLLDRLARNEVRLTTTRQPDEIEHMLIRRLATAAACTGSRPAVERGPGDRHATAGRRPDPRCGGGRAARCCDRARRRARRPSRGAGRPAAPDHRGQDPGRDQGAGDRDRPAQR
jgi:hypothetical protein